MTDTDVSHSQSEKSLRVLIVDDYPDAADSLALLLRIWGHDVCVCRTGQEALEEAPSYLPDVALIDLVLPGMDGCHLVTRLRQLDALRRTIFIAVTGLANVTTTELAIDAGFSLYMLKPFNLEELRAVLAAVPRAQEANACFV